MRELGADHVFDYRACSLESLGRYDVIMDAIGTRMGKLRHMLAPGGRMVELGYDPDHLLRTVLQVAASAVFGSRRIRAFSNNPSQADIARLTTLTENGVIKPMIEKVWDLEDIVEATKAVEGSSVRGMHVVKLT
jgi:D-arabinose 1-dehydrogenase-like Zn-dependent alcohol dehydrogenase